MKFKKYGEGGPLVQAPGGRPPAYDLAREKAREAAIERSLCLYIPLKCGHITTWDIDEQYAHWRPKRSNKKEPSVFFCEQCGSWEERIPKFKRDAYPEEPLF